MLNLSRRSGRIVLAALAAPLIPTEARAQAERVAGCYDIYLSEWSPGDPGADSIYYAPPTRVQFTVDPGVGLGRAPKGYAVKAAPDAMPSLHEYSWWELRRDTVIIMWSTGFTGLTLRLVGRDTLRGTAHTFTDVVPGPRFTTRVVASPVDCRAPIEDERRLRHRFPPVVHLANGDSIAVDATIDSAVIAQRPTARSVIITGTAIEPLHGAIRIEASLRDDGTTRSLRLHYPAAATFADLLARLSQVWGAPSTPPTSTTRPLALWSSRLLQIGLTGGDGVVGPTISITSRRRM